MRGDEGCCFGAGVGMFAGSAESRCVCDLARGGEHALRKLGGLLVQQGKRRVGVACGERSLGGLKQPLLLCVRRGGGG